MQLKVPDEQIVLSGLRVMVIDDVTDCRDVVELYLTQIKAEVKAVSSVQEALSIMKQFKPKLVISDIYMPDLDGYWLIEQLKKLKLESEIKVKAIALTAAAEESDRDRLLAAGYDGYLAKPFVFEDLNRLITKLIN